MFRVRRFDGRRINDVKEPRIPLYLICSEMSNLGATMRHDWRQSSGMSYLDLMARKKRTLTATMADGYVKTISTTAPFTHYWRIVASLPGGKTEVFWGHANSFKEAAGKRTATEDAARQRGWERFDFEIVELTES